MISARQGCVLAAFVAAISSSPAALAQISDAVVKIGVLTDMNGPASTPTGQGSVTAAQIVRESEVHAPSIANNLIERLENASPKLKS